MRYLGPRTRKIPIANIPICTAIGGAGNGNNEDKSSDEVPGSISNLSASATPQNIRPAITARRLILLAHLPFLGHLIKDVKNNTHPSNNNNKSGASQTPGVDTHSFTSPESRSF